MTTPPQPPLRLSPDPPLPLDEMRLALVVAPVAALDLPSSPASRRDPSTEDRDRGFLNPTKWYVRFEDAREVGRWINGLIYSHPSRWMTIRDEGEILAGRHLNVDEELAIGKRLSIDFFPYRGS